MTANTNVNVSPAQTESWINADGLRVKFGATEAEKGKGGEFNNTDRFHVSEIDVDYTVAALGTDATHNVILDYDLIIPSGAIIEKVEFEVVTAWDSASSDVVLNFGTLSRPAAGSTSFTIVDADGLMAAVAKSVIDLAGNLVVSQAAGSYPDITTYSGAQVGTAISGDCVVSCYWGNHVPTAGAGKLRLYWRDAA